MDPPVNPVVGGGPAGIGGGGILVSINFIKPTTSNRTGHVRPNPGPSKLWIRNRVPMVTSQIGPDQIRLL